MTTKKTPDGQNPCADARIQELTQDLLRAMPSLIRSAITRCHDLAEAQTPQDAREAQQLTRAGNNALAHLQGLVRLLETLMACSKQPVDGIERLVEQARRAVLDLENADPLPDPEP